LLISLTLLFQSFDVLDLYFQSQIKSKYTVISKNAAFAVAAGTRLALIHFKASIVLFAASNVLEALLGALCLWLVYSRTGGSMRSWKYASSRARTLLRESWPLILAGTATMIYMRIDVVMLEHMAGATAVGIYAAATRLSEVWYFIPMAIVSSISPVIMQSRPDREIYELRLQQLFSFMVLISVLIAIFMSFGYSHLVHLVFGPNYASSAPILAVHIWASVFVFLGVAQTPWDTAESLMRLSLKRTAAGAVVNVILNLILIPRYAGMGAAVATLVAYSLSAVFANVFFAPTRKIFVMQMRSFYLYGCADLFQSAWRMLRLKGAHG
jgi:PST family polysaccharide transporter